MHLVYIDDSGDEHSKVFSAFVIPATEWRSVLQTFISFRRGLSDSDGINIRSEFHAWKFISGRGHLGNTIVGKGRRCEIFHELLKTIAQIPDVRLFNAFFSAKDEFRAMEWLLNRINRAMLNWDSHAMLLIDEGKDAAYTHLVRRLQRNNPVPGRYGGLSENSTLYPTRNLPLERLIEDPVFRHSDQSYFIQAVDFCAYALLRRERPLESKTRYGLDQAFNILAPILVREANVADPDGIIRAGAEEVAI